MPGLRVATDLELPIDLVVQKTAILARSGAGKTNTAVYPGSGMVAATDLLFPALGKR